MGTLDPHAARARRRTRRPRPRRRHQDRHARQTHNQQPAHARRHNPTRPHDPSKQSRFENPTSMTAFFGLTHATADPADSRTNQPHHNPSSPVPHHPAGPEPAHPRSEHGIVRHTRPQRPRWPDGPMARWPDGQRSPSRRSVTAADQDYGRTIWAAFCGTPRPSTAAQDSPNAPPHSSMPSEPGRPNEYAPQNAPSLPARGKA